MIEQKEDAAAALRVTALAAASEVAELRAVAAADQEAAAEHLKRASQELTKKADQMEQQQKAMQVGGCFGPMMGVFL